MKIIKKIKLIIPVITFVPAIIAVFLPSSANIALSDIISNKLIQRSLFASLILYLIYFGYKKVYLSRQEQNLTAPLLFLFNYNMIHNLSMLFCSIAVISTFGVNLSSNLGICYFLSIVILGIKVVLFETDLYRGSHKSSTLEKLEKSQLNSVLIDTFISSFITISLALIAINDNRVIYDFGLLSLLALWNYIFTQLIRPQLFLYIKDE